MCLKRVISLGGYGLPATDYYYAKMKYDNCVFVVTGNFVCGRLVVLLALVNGNYGFFVVGEDCVFAVRGKFVFDTVMENIVWPALAIAKYDFGELGEDCDYFVCAGTGKFVSEKAPENVALPVLVIVTPGYVVLGENRVFAVTGKFVFDTAMVNIVWLAMVIDARFLRAGGGLRLFRLLGDGEFRLR